MVNHFREDTWHRQHYFIIVVLSHGVGYMRALLYCFPYIFYCFFLEKKVDLNKS
jgi:hypothetical protein